MSIMSYISCSAAYSLNYCTVVLADYYLNRLSKGTKLEIS